MRYTLIGTNKKTNPVKCAVLNQFTNKKKAESYILEHYDTLTKNNVEIRIFDTKTNKNYYY